MCPICISSAAMFIASTASTGGLTALMVKKVRRVFSSNSTDRSNDVATRREYPVEIEPRQTRESFPVYTKGERP